MQPTSSEIAHEEDYRIRHEIEPTGMAPCSDCETYESSTRDVTICGVVTPLCRLCRPFDRPCVACEVAEAMPGFDGCLACTIEGDLLDVRAEIVGMA